MEEGAKRRLVGAAVMVLLLVIFLPMLFDEDTDSPVTDSDLAVPPRPKFDEGYKASVTDGADESVDSEESVLPGFAPADVGTSPQELAPPPIFEAPAAGETALEPESEAPVVAKDEPPGPDSKPRRALPEPPPAPKRPEQRTPAISANVSTWVVQVASVRDQSRARALQQELRRKGFPAFIEQADVRHNLWNRVRVGPEADRKRIESMAASIEKQTGLNVQVQRYP